MNTHNHWLKGVQDDLAPYGVDNAGDIALEMIHDQAPNHEFLVGDRVESELSGRTGIVKQFTRAVVLVEYDDIHTNVNHSKAPNAWVPHGVLRKIGGAS